MAPLPSSWSGPEPAGNRNGPYMQTPETVRPWRRKPAVVLLVALFVLSAYLAWNRIYQVDEAQNMYMARVVGTGQSAYYFTTAALWLTGPMAWLAGSARESARLFGWGRLFGLTLFWSNIFLIALNAGAKLRTGKGLAILLAAATLAPLWDYGFEFRHDNLLLTGLLSMWWIGRARPKGMASYLALGAMTVTLQFIAFKAFAYLIPLNAILLVFPHPAHRNGRIQLGAAWLAGALAALGLWRLVYQIEGLWPVLVAGLHGGVESSSGAARFGPGLALGRLPAQTPLLLATTGAAFWGLGRKVRIGGLQALAAAEAAPEALLLLGMSAAFLANPTPFPYNLVNLVPFAFILSIRALDPIFRDLGERPWILLLAGGVVCFCHAVPFAAATARHLAWSNERQEFLMNTAEALTAPAIDPVYDAIGMVPTRPSINFRWYLHSLNIRSFLDGKQGRVQQLLAANPPAVIIPSYRTDWLSAEDWNYIRAHYLPLADDFWVLGQVLPLHGGTFTVLHQGRYLLLGQHANQVTPLAAGILDGHPCGYRPVVLKSGSHELTCGPDTQPIPVWIGPQLESLPPLGAGDHHRLFANWY